ncbi:Putative methyltransferase type 11, S-adenosyl-L-methionine-dependent methyltransferase [Septoria linicola]|uniref:Methyltransferase type 11, S-adenosyl-L-methionine-dependent methyltransferase n=1 Tax=Septoria linicola TaxID=215465 RepID=A0A9Q9AY18_9PEZI|nr:putative methyltransferase type 11, S-adenosyl-L-methionine-dependent methyltransferase [Septoria linicola]USW57215.1 Putative methyltransferase type 11, S-adenosyl-L-methionine-dependent methyltransferase [Septoria linicola]
MAAIATDPGNNRFLEAAYKLKTGTEAECKALYEEWAETYDNDVLEGQAYVGPMMTAAAVKAANGRVEGECLDAGTGTGLCAVALHQAGARTIDGIDISEGMLKVAERTKVFRNLKPVDMSKPIDIADNKYDVVTCVGTFTLGHVGPTPGISELVRVLKKGGVMAATIIDDIWVPQGFKAEVERLRDAGKVEIVSTELADYRKAYNVRARLVVLRKK